MMFKRYDVRDVMAGCPACGSIDRTLSGGMELNVNYVELVESQDGE